MTTRRVVPGHGRGVVVRRGGSGRWVAGDVAGGRGVDERGDVAVATGLDDVDDDGGDVVGAAVVVGRVDQGVRGAGRVDLAGEDGADVVLADHAGQAVGAQQHAVARDQLEGDHVDVDTGFDAERPRDHRAARIELGLLLGELAGLDELGDDAVVDRDPLERPVARRGRRASRRRGR